MSTLKQTDSSSGGCECIYFSLKGTGWKVFYKKEVALIAWATQKWAYERSLAPKVLSDIQPIELQKPLPRSMMCPLKVSIFKQHNNYTFYKGGVVPCSKHIIESYKKGVFEKKYGFITEEVKVADTICQEDYEEKYHELKESIEELVSDTFDWHRGNWGILNNEAVFIDFGTHFTECAEREIKDEINHIMDSANLSKQEIKKSYL